MLAVCSLGALKILPLPTDLPLFVLDKMQTTTIGPRRSVAAQRQPSRSSTADGQRPQDVVSLSQSLAANTLLTQDSRNLPSSSSAAAAAAGESTENASITTCSVSGTVDNMLGGNFNQQDRQMDLPKPLKSNLDIGSRNESVSTKVQSLVSSSTLTSNGDALAFVLRILHLFAFFMHCQLFSLWLMFTIWLLR